MAGSTGIRGTRIGSGPMGEQDYGVLADRIEVRYWDALGNETVRYYSADIAAEDIPDVIDCPASGMPAGRDRENPPSNDSAQPYKTHFEYVQERRSAEEGAALLEDALKRLRERRGTA